MQKTLLVPLDGSEESEAALPWATKLAQDRDLTLTLARVVEYPNYAAGGYDESMSVEVYEQVLETEEEEAKSYLDEVRKQLAETGLQVETIMRDGRPAFTLLDLADELSAAAIVIASHGRRRLQAGCARQCRHATGVAHVDPGLPGPRHDGRASPGAGAQSAPGPARRVCPG